MTDFFVEDIEGEEADRIVQDITGEYDEPEAGFVQGAVRGPTAKRYEKKIKTVLNVLFKETVTKEKTVPDAAAIIMYGPNFAEKWGDLAEHDKRVRKGVEMILDGTENPYIAAAVATMPLFLQLYRNHEETLRPSGAVEAIRAHRKATKEREPRRFKIPFTKRYVEFRWRFNMPGVKSMTNEPQQLAAFVFNNPEIIAAMRKAGIDNIGGQSLNGDARHQSPTR